MKVTQLIRVFLRLMSRMFSNMVYVHRLKNRNLFAHASHTAAR